MHHAKTMYSNLFSCSLDVLQLVLSLNANVLNLADRLINVWDFSLLSCFDALSCHLQIVQSIELQCLYANTLDTVCSLV